MTLDEALLAGARGQRDRLLDLQHEADKVKLEYHHAIRKLHAGGGSLREIADALGLSHQRVHQIVDESPRNVPYFELQCPPFPPGPWLRRMHKRHGRRGDFLGRFAAAAREAMVEAQGEADALRHSYVGTEHIMLALLRRGAGGLEASYDAARAEVVRRVGEGDESSSARLPRPFTPRAKRALEAALTEATAAQREQITIEDLLLAIASDSKGAGGEILQSLGVTPEQLRERLGR